MSTPPVDLDGSAAAVSILGMGGTISTECSSAGAIPERDAATIARELSLPVDLRARDVRTVSSRAVTPGDMWALAGAVREEIDSGVRGVVITHGTDTLEETAYALSLLVDTPVPVVLTGAMRAPHLPGADGSANLTAAVVAALHPPLAGYGPVVVFQDEIHVARLVTKRHSARIAAFASPAAGPVGSVSEQRVELLLGPSPHRDRLPTTAPPDAYVELIWAAAGTDGSLVDAIAGEVDGLVIAGTGGGHLSPPLAEAAVRLAGSPCPVVLASRCEDGRPLHTTYGGIGSETHLLAAGLLSSGVLSPVKARLRLLFGLSAGITPELIFPAAGPPFS
ncbi:asparaginase [Pseudonocardia spinosispora]|uniref:asparaginase n=1 Tax=Pseudonocardia spinosispora TaxID=103441 RepID=UPI000413E882|nr:asparaginase [Pseudonocardia spinosispora]